MEDILHTTVGIPAAIASWRLKQRPSGYEPKAVDAESSIEASAGRRDGICSVRRKSLEYHPLGARIVQQVTLARSGGHSVRMLLINSGRDLAGRTREAIV